MRNPHKSLPTIKNGSHGLSVAYCQNLLNARSPGQVPLWVDGIFGLKTDVRVRRYQTTKGLVADGVVGPLTWAALETGPPPIKKRPATTTRAAEAPVVVPAAGGI